MVNNAKWVLQKYPVNACAVRDGLSGDMLVSSRRSLVLKCFNVWAILLDIFCRFHISFCSHCSCISHSKLYTAAMGGSHWKLLMNITRSSHTYRTRRGECLQVTVVSYCKLVTNGGQPKIIIIVQVQYILY